MMGAHRIGLAMSIAAVPLALAAAALLRWLLDGTPASAVPGTSYYIAILALAWWVGPRAGYFAVLLSLPVAWLMARAAGEPGPTGSVELLQLAGFLALASWIVTLVARLRRAELGAQEDRLWSDAILRSVPDAVVVADAQGRFQFANGSARKLLELPEGNLSDLRVEEYLSFATGHPVEGKDAAAPASMRELAWLQRPAGAVPVVCSSAGISDSAGRCLGQVTVMRDVSELHAAFDQLADSERRFERFREAGLIGVFFIDEAGVLTEPNRTFLEMLGHGVGQGGGLSWEGLCAGCGDGTASALLEKLRSSQPSGIVEERCRRPEGSDVWLVLCIGEPAGGRFPVLAVDMSPLKRMDAALRDQRLLMEAIIDQTPALIAYLGPDRRFRLHNRLFQDWYPEHTLEGQRLEDIVKPVHAEQTRMHLQRAFAGDPVHGELTIEVQDARHNLDAHYVPHRDSDGGIAGVIVHAYDITDRVAAENRARTNEARLRCLATASGSVVWHAGDADGTVVALQGQGWRAEGNEATRIGAVWFARLHPFDRERLRHAWRQAVLARGELELELRVRDSEVGWRQVVLHAVPVPVTDGGPEWIGTVVDVHERRMTQRLLVERESGQRALLENIPDKVWIATPDGTIDYNNPRWYEYTGLRPGEHWRHALHPADQIRARQAWARAITSGEPLNSEMRFLRAADRTYRWHLVRAVPIRDEQNGQIVRWYGSTTDIEDQKNAQDALRRANERINRFLATLSHELRNPLAGILSGCDLLARPELQAAAATETLLRIARQGRHLQRIVDDLLDVARITQGKIMLRAEPVDIGQLVRDAHGDALQRGRAAGIAVDLEVRTQRRVNGDPARLQQILDNLISNAIDASAPGGTVGILVEEQGDEIQIRVRDEGAGMSESLQAELFDPFVQGKQIRASGGLGLGLTVVRELAELHQGRVKALSQGEGRGSEFIVSLPSLSPENEGGEEASGAASAAAARDEAGREAGSDAPTRTRGTGKRRILLVDDEDENAQTMAMLLEFEGFAVTHRLDVDSALDAVRETAPDVVLCDIGLGKDNSGLDVARALAGSTPRPYLIAYTGFGQARDRERCLEAGFDVHLTKPAPVDELLRVIRAAPPERKRLTRGA